MTFQRMPCTIELVGWLVSQLVLLILSHFTCFVSFSSVKKIEKIMFVKHIICRNATVILQPVHYLH